MLTSVVFIFILTLGMARVTVLAKTVTAMSTAKSTLNVIAEMLFFNLVSLPLLYNITFFYYTFCRMFSQITLSCESVNFSLKKDSGISPGVFVKGQLLYKLNQNFHSSVALTLTDLYDTCISAVAVCIL